MLIVCKTPWRLATMMLAALVISGCEKPSKPPAQQNAEPAAAAASVTLSVAVAEDSPLAAAITRLRGEWAELGGGELKVVTAGADPLAKDFPAADLVVFPSRKLGELCEAGYLRPMRHSTLESEELAFNDIYPLVREKEIVYGKRVMALPLGSYAPLTLATIGDAPPATWPAFTRRFGGGAHFGEELSSAVLERAACYATHPARVGVLFEPDTMRPLVHSPPVLRAVEEVLAAVEGHGDDFNPTRLGPPGPGEAIVVRPIRTMNESWEDCKVSPRPGASEVFDPIAAEWTTASGGPQRVPLLGVEGRLMGVTAGSRNAAAAFRLAAWLAGQQNAKQLTTSSPAVAPVRRSLSRVADDWLTGGSSALGREFAAAHAETLTGRDAFLVPRIYRIDDYLSAMERALSDALGSKAPESTETVVQQIDAQWEALTEAVGRDRQAAAYRRHLGLEEYEPPRR